MNSTCMCRVTLFSNHRCNQSAAGSVHNRPCYTLTAVTLYQILVTFLIANLFFLSPALPHIKRLNINLLS